jgi:hypothetical protein
MTNSDQRKRREDLIADLRKIGTGWTPDTAALAEAPLLDQWSFVVYPGTSDLAMQGVVAGHPRLPDGPVITSPIMALDLPARWMRTHGRFYRLGKRDIRHE